MRLAHYPEEKLKSEVKRIVGKHLNLDEYELFFFGSRVTGKGDERSDIDIGIRGKNKIPTELMWKIKDDINSKIHTLYSIDIIDFSATGENFRQVAEQRIEKFQ